jgi:hypothetical protein
MSKFIRFASIPVYIRETMAVAFADDAFASGLVMKKDGSEYIVWQRGANDTIRRATRLQRQGCYPLGILSVVEAPGGTKLRLRAVRELEDVPNIGEVLDEILDAIERALVRSGAGASRWN